MGFLDKLFGRKEETDDQREIRLYNDSTESQQSDSSDYPQTSDGPAKFAISNIFTVAGRGTVVVGEVVEGSFSVGDTVKVGNTSCRISGLEQFRKMCQTVHMGENTGMVLEGISRDKLRIDDIIIK